MASKLGSVVLHRNVERDFINRMAEKDLLELRR